MTTTVDVSIERKSNRKRPRNHEGSINSINSCLESKVVSNKSSTISSSSGSNDAPSSVSGSGNTAVSSSGPSNTAVSSSGPSNTAVSSSGPSNTAVSSSGPSNTAVSSSGPSNTAVSSSGPSNTAVSSSGPSNTAVSSSGSDSSLESGSSRKHISVSFKARIRRSAKRRKMGCPVTRDQNYYTSFSLKKENFVRYSERLIYFMLDIRVSINISFYFRKYFSL